MPFISVTSIDDPRIVAYRDLPRTKLPRTAGLFIAEGRLLVKRLLASEFEVDSILIDENERDWVTDRCDPQTTVYVTPSGMVEQIVGFNFHRGVIACGRRQQPRSAREFVTASRKDATILVCVDVKDPENLGGIMRSCAAFGVDGVLLNKNCVDPFSRRVLRVSMGSVLKLPIAQSEDLQADLNAIRAEFQFELIAAVLDGKAEKLAGVARSDRVALLVGNEAHGLSEQWCKMCDRQVTIPMRSGIDSLNVSVATGILLYRFVQELDNH